MSETSSVPESLVLSVEELSMPSTAEGIIEVLRRVLTKPYVQSVHLRTGRPIEVSWYKDISDSLHIAPPDEAPESVLARVVLEEVVSSKPPRDALMDAMLKLNGAGNQATHLFVGSVDFFKDWLGIPSVLTLPLYEGTEFINFIGLRLLETEPLEKDVVVLLGGPTKQNALNDLTHGYKITT